MCYSDGITEARNINGEEFGIQRLVQSVTNTNNNATARGLYKIICSETERFTKRGKLIDDITLMIVKVK